MELYYILFNEIRSCFHYESHNEHESRPKNGYEIIEKCFSLEEASKRTNQLDQELRNGYNRSYNGY